MKYPKIKLALLAVGTAMVTSCDTLEQSEGTWNQFQERVEKLDSVIDQETGRLHHLDSLVDQETQRMEKLDSLIRNF